MVLSRLTKITGPGVSTDTNWVGNNADFTGITTSGTSFNIGITTIHSNLIEAHNIKSTGILTATGGSFSGNVTAVDGTFSGNVSIAGTLTYEDVTNIDAVGIITAPALDVDDFLDVGSNIKLGNAGVITATSFVGSGAALTGIDATAIKDSGGNVKIQAQASGAIHTGVSTFQDLTVEKSANLNVNIKSTGGWGALEVGGATAGYIDIKKPFSDDFDLRLMVDGSGTNYISSNAANLKLDAQGNNGIELGAYGAPSLKYSNDTKLVTTSAGVSIPKDLDVDGHTNLDNVSIAGVVTATTFSGSGASLTNLNASAIASGTVPTARLGSGTASSSTFLAGDSTYKTVTGTTINSNADNRVITGSGTANTLNAEQYLTWDGQIFKVNAATNDNPFQLDTGSSNGAHMRFFRNGTQLHFFGCGTGISLGDSEDLSMRSYDNILFSTGNSSSERVRITSNGDLKLSGSTALSSPSTGYKRIVIGNNLILNAGSSAGGYTGFQNNAYVNSSGNWVRVNNDYASSIGMDDGNIYFRNVGAGTGNISWSMPLQIYANGTSTFGSTVTVNGYVLSQGSSGRGGIFGQIQVGLENLYNTIQNAQANTPIHLQYNNTGDVKCNEGGGDLRTADIIPHTNNSSNLGSSTRRWANIHTNDLNLSNEGNSNEVDGTWGQYTIQEGQDDLFLINRRSGKRYKFLLQEID